jgi:hypothetical protein
MHLNQICSLVYCPSRISSLASPICQYRAVLEMLQITGSPFPVRFKITLLRRTGGHCTMSNLQIPHTSNLMEDESHMHSTVN